MVGNCLRTFELEEHEFPETRPFEPWITACCYAIRSTYHTTLEGIPCQLVFGRDMLLPIQFKARWAYITLRKQDRIVEPTRKIPYDYQVGMKVLLEKPGINPRLTAPRPGPYEITKIHTNGTIQIQKTSKYSTCYSLLWLGNVRKRMPWEQYSHRPSGIQVVQSNES